MMICDVVRNLIFGKLGHTVMKCLLSLAFHSKHLVSVNGDEKLKDFLYTNITC